mgnify:CR=1 FL=1
MQSPRRKSRRRLTRKQKGKMKAPEYGTETETSNQRESDMATGKDVPPRVRSESGERATKSATQKLRRSTRQKNTVMWFGYNEYMAHHYVYMMRVAEVHEPESYADAAKDTNWRAAMEEEMCALAENETWDLVDAPNGVKPIGCMWVYKVK